jgi:hypothetical protein
MGAQHIIGNTGGYLAEVDKLGNLRGGPLPITNIGTLRPGGAFNIVSNSLASPTVVTTVAPHLLTSGDTIFWTASAVSVPLLTVTPQQVVTVLTPTTFSIPVNCSTGGTSGAYDVSILSTPTTPGAAPLVNCGRAHGLRVGDTVTITASNSTPSLDGVQTVTAIVSTTAFRVLTSAVPTTGAGSTTTGHFSKTTFYTDVIDRGAATSGGAVVITSVISTATNSVLVDIQGSVDGTNWFNIPYSLVATPRTFVLTQLTITTSTAVTYLLQELVFWRYLRLKHSTSSNISTVVTATYI